MARTPRRLHDYHIGTALHPGAGSPLSLALAASGCESPGSYLNAVMIYFPLNSWISSFGREGAISGNNIPPSREGSSPL